MGYTINKKPNFPSKNISSCLIKWPKDIILNPDWLINESPLSYVKDDGIPNVEAFFQYTLHLQDILKHVEEIYN